MSQCHSLHHPRSRGLIPIINGTFGIVKNLDEDFFKFENGAGRMVSRKSASKVVDKFVEGENEVRPAEPETSFQLIPIND